MSPIVPDSWKITPATLDFHLNNKGERWKGDFELTPLVKTDKASQTKIIGEAIVNGKKYDKQVIHISYDHIPTQVVLKSAEAKLIAMPLENKAHKVAYLKGAGDEVPAALRQIGYNVTMLTEKELSEDLSKFDAIVVGVRAYNTEERLKFYQKKLMEYVEKGGNMVVQYQVNNNLQKVEGGMGPFPFKVSRDRVTVEEAEIRFLKPESIILNSPNKITAKDFEGWVEERIVSYFASHSFGKYKPLS